MKSFLGATCMLLTLAALSSCSSGSSGLKNAQAACSTISSWNAYRSSFVGIAPAGSFNNMIHNVQKDADQAASVDHQWQPLADDARTVESAYALGQHSPPGGSGVVQPNLALDNAWQQIETECTHVQSAPAP